MGRQILTLLGFIISKDLDKFLNTITLKYWCLSIDKYYLKLSIVPIFPILKKLIPI